MTLYFIGIGLHDEKDITIKGLEAIKQCAVVYLETYTSKLSRSLESLKKFYGKDIIPADRDLVENRAEKTILKDACEKNVAFLVIGDPLVATTHVDLWLRAKKANIPVKIIHNSTILSAIAETGLQLYTFGPVASIPFHDEKFFPETPYTIIKENHNRGLHTLVLLDLRPSENKFMTVKEGLQYLLALEEKRKDKIISPNLLVVGCARIGSPNSVIKSGKLHTLQNHDFGEQPHCIIIPGKLHFIEEEMLALLKI